MFSSIFFLLPLLAYGLPGHLSLLEKRDTCAPPPKGTKFCAVFGDPHFTSFKHNFNPSDINFFGLNTGAEIIGLGKAIGATTSYSLFKGQALSTIIEVNFKVFQTPNFPFQVGVTDLQRVVIYQRDAVTLAILNSIDFQVLPEQLGSRYAVVTVGSTPGQQWLPSRKSLDGRFSYYDFVANNVKVGTFGVSASPFGLNFAMNIEPNRFNLEKATGACLQDITAINKAILATQETFPQLV